MKGRKQKYKRLRRFHEPGHLHELTFSCYRRLPLLTNDDWRRRLSRSLDSAGDSELIRLVGFVLMPEHVHLLTFPITPTPRLDRYLARLKRPFAREIKEILVASRRRLLDKLTVRERPGKTCFRFWQEGAGYDRNLYSPKAIRSALDYIHMNPVRRGLCQRAIDWKWSSARYYLLEPVWQQFPDLPFIHGLPSGCLENGWRG